MAANGNLDQMDLDEFMMHATPQQVIARYRVVCKEFVKSHPFSSLDELRSVMSGPLGVGFMGETAREWMAVLNDRTYPLLKAVYDTAGNDKAVNRSVGEQLNRMGGFPYMQGGFYTLANYSPLSLDGRENDDPNQQTWLYNKLQADWNGVGSWLA